MRGLAKLVTVEEAIAAIPSGATIAVSGFVGSAHPEYLSRAVEQRFLATQEPQGLTLIYAAGQGDGKTRGLNHFAHEGLLRCVIGGHWNLCPTLGRMALENKIEAYNFPQGVISVLFREIAAGRPGLFTKVGINTFIDPVNGGGRLNERTVEPLVERITLRGEDWLWYHSIPVDVAFIRGTSADSRGNISMSREGIIGEALPIAQAAKNSGGIVIAQVEEIVDSIPNPKDVRVPGLLVDYIVVAEPGQHDQTFAEAFNESYVQQGGCAVSLPLLAWSERKIIGRRALREIRPGSIVNLGIGMPEAVACAASEEGRLADFTLTVESGPIGGLPASGLSFGCSVCPEAIVDQPSQFDFYDGGGMDIAVLGAAQIDSHGNVNVSSFAGRFAGVGGFVNITQAARCLVFCGPLRAGGLKLDWDGELKIVNEGGHVKFVQDVDQICFHGPSALERGQSVLYVTERAVFQLTPSGLELIEVAPGVDIETQVLDQMEFAPIVGEPKLMDAALFAP